MSTLDSDVHLAMSGDSAAYARIVAQCANTVSTIAYAIVRNIQASEDVAQESFLAAWRDLKKLRNASSFLPWLRQITRNQAHLWLRDHRREIAGDNLLAQALDPRPLQDDILLDDEQRRVVNEVVDALPEQTREVLVLYYREGSSVAHVADLLGISDDAVKQRLSRARGALREETLRRFGATMTKTAPAAAFLTAVAAAIAGAAPPASAAIVASTAAKTGAALPATVAKVAGLGAIAGLFGVWASMKHLEPYFDEREARELSLFRMTAAIMILVACIGFAVVPSSIAVLLAYYATTGYLCWFRLPRILDRRMAWEREVNPEVAAMHRRQQVWSSVGQTLGAMLSGGVLMMGVADFFR